MWPRWSLQVTDADFYDLDTSQPIVIEVTLSPVPEQLAVDGVYGQYLRGWKDGGLLEEPEDGVEPAITIRLEIGEEVQPEWTVVVDRETLEPAPIGAKRRAMFGVVRLGGWHVRDLTWARGSAFARAADTDDTGTVLTEAHRTARDSVKVDVDGLAEVLAKIGGGAAAFGVGEDAIRELQVILDPTVTGFGAGALVLANSKVPLRQAGLGTSRLAALAVQVLASGDAGIVLVDEVEHGLEPHRIIGLTHELRRRLDIGEGEKRGGRVFMTTHAPVAVCEIGGDGVHVVRRDDGVVTVQPAGTDLTDLVRGYPDALLARRVVVCEGRTEMGICRGLEQVRWKGDDGEGALSHRGIALADGRGNDQAPKTAVRLAGLGYDVLLFADSDVPLGVQVGELEEAGVTVVQWDGEVATEERCADDLPRDGLVRMVEYTVETFGLGSVRDTLNHRLGDDGPLEGDAPGAWIDQIGENVFRRVFGATAKESDRNDRTARGSKPKGWFKTIDAGEYLGAIIAEAWEGLEGTDLRAKLSQIEEWVYEDGG